MLKYAVLILWRKKGVPANFYAFCISDASLSVAVLTESFQSCIKGWSLMPELEIICNSHRSSISVDNLVRGGDGDAFRAWQIFALGKV